MVSAWVLTSFCAYLASFKQYLNQVSHLRFCVSIKIQMISLCKRFHGVDSTAKHTQILMNKGLWLFCQAFECAGGNADNRCQLTPAINQFHCVCINAKQRSFNFGQTSLP